MADTGEAVTINAYVKTLEERVRELERDLESVRRENELLRESNARALKIATHRVERWWEDRSALESLAKGAELLKR